MICSKLFSGNFPELTDHIMQYLRNDHKSLYSCTLVNRFFCRIAIPMLWEDPFSIECKEEYLCNFIEIYFLFLNKVDKPNLGLKIHSSTLKKPLFSYPSFIKTLNTFRIELHVVNWINNLDSLSDTNVVPTNRVQQSLFTFKSNKMIYHPLTLTNHFEVKSLEVKKVLLNSKETINKICASLIKLFMSYNASLNNLDICIDYYCTNHFFYRICKLILENPKLSSSMFSSIKSLNFNLKYVNDISLTKSLTNAAQSHSHLSTLTITSTASNMICFFDVFKHCSKTLTSIKFLNCDFTDITSFDGLKYLSRLKSLYFVNCDGLKFNVIQPLLDIPTPLEIKSLTILGEIEEIAPIKLLLQKITRYIENLELRIWDNIMRESVLENVNIYCEKIKFLHLDNIDYVNIPQICELVSHFNNNLKYLTLEYKIHNFRIEDMMMRNNRNQDHDDDLKVSSMILRELGRLLPDTLEYLDMNLVIDPNDLKNFLNHCKRIELKKLLIRNRSKNNLRDTLRVLKDFVSEKNLEYLAYGIGNNFTPEEESRHRSLEGLIKEIKYFVKMKRYEDLVVKISDF